ncbi:hypothetical protein [Cellulomonas marina]|uniref:Uncharacterized protein n=1 Tax=Cellulomonas marina TaxID=988821 RepID=A0A1I1AGV8_9CELL|nr:hypothetical protein [Cellulomonas marina]GIG30188.1 hypothetical protein Cma02nite_27880 [Cellulomonas marina]SFB37177.1 hypothetical protein SAMN05421867_11837 [Cellulomonas marina]
MPGDDLPVTGAVSKALLDALDQMHDAVTASLVNPDGSPSTTAVYMQLPIGQPVDPKMYANPWTPAGGSAYAAVSSTGVFAPPPVTTAPTGPETAPTPAAQAAAAGPDPRLQLAISSAFNTARRVDDMLMVTDNGVAVAWPQRTVSIEYFAALKGMQAEPIPEPAQDVKDRIAAAQATLYLQDANGNLTGYTPLYTQYRRNLKTLADARAAFANAYSRAMSDPVSGQSWPVTSASLQDAVDQAYNDLKAMGGQKIEDALATLQSIGGNAAASLIAKANQLYDAYSVGLGGSVAVKVPWSYIDPVSWWDHTNRDFGVQRVVTSSSHYEASSGHGSHRFSSSFYRNRSSSTSGSAGFSMFGFGASANAGYRSDSHTDGSSGEESSWNHFEDKSSTATLEYEWFVASIERPWLLGDLFHMDGWYLTGQKKGAISDGTIAGQIGDVPKLLPMIPKAFVVVRNVKITCDDFGSVADAWEQASSSSSGSTSSSSTSVGGSVGWLGLGGSVQHQSSASDGAFSSGADSSGGWRFTRSGSGGTLELLGSQIAGWIGQIQPEAPRKDDPNLASDEDVPADPVPAPVPEPAPVP